MQRPCHFCGQPFEESYRVCAQCGRPNRTPRQVRILGWVTAAAGAFQIRHGRANARMLSVVLLLGGALFVSGMVVVLFF